MIDFIQLTEFQSHRATALNFESGVNVIVGQSDCGKSAVLRALRFVLENKPNGDSFINHKSKFTLVNLALTDGHSVTREKGDDGNRYELATKLPNGKSTCDEFTAFGQGVPDPIAHATKFHNVNFQQQLDAPFLLSMTPGEAGQYLNSVMNLDLIDATVKAIQQQARDNKNECARLATNLANLESELGAYDWLPNAVKLVAKLKQLEDKREAVKESKRELETVVNAVCASKPVPVPDIAPMLKELAACEKECGTLEDTLDDFHAVLAQIDTCEKSLAVIAGNMIKAKKELDKIKVCSECGRPL